MKRINRQISLTFREAVELNIVTYAFKLMNAILRHLASLIYSRNSKPSRILIFRTGSMGDSLSALPVIAAIRKKYSASQIDILINPGKAKSTLVSIDQLLSPSVYDNAINYFGLSVRKTVSVLRANKYDLIIQLPQGDAPFLTLLRDLLFYRFIVSAGWGWEVGKILFFRKMQEKYIKYDREVVRLAKIAERNQVHVDLNDFPLNIRHEDVVFVEEWFEQLEITDKKVIGVVIGAKRPQNRWPLAYFSNVISHFAGIYNVIVIGGEEDKDAASELAVNPYVFNSCGSFTPMQSAVAITKCVVVLSNDTGPMHLSYAVGAPTVAVFSSRDFKGAWFPPENGRNIVFRSENIPCALCLSDYCSNNICMQDIKPPLVISAMSRLIEETSTV